MTGSVTTGSAGSPARASPGYVRVQPTGVRVPALSVDSARSGRFREPPGDGAVVDERERLSGALPSYELAGEIGRGGWSVVFEATHRTLQRRVAIKYLPAAFSTDPAARDRFRAEARVVASLDHPHIVPLYDFVEHDDTCVFVMELMPGGTLRDRFSAGELIPEAACNVTLALLGALHHAHERGVLHRDTKPENVLFNAEGMPKLADFGIAKVLGANAGTRTATGMIMGTPAYMAPEQGSGEPVSPATDLYAIGAMLYELLSGRLPFESTGNALAQLYRHVHEPPAPIKELVPELPDGLATVVMRALEKSPSDRYTDASTFATELNTQATAAFGGDWSARSKIPVLATRSVLGYTVGKPPVDDPTERSNTPPSAPSAFPPPAATPPSPRGIPAVAGTRPPPVADTGPSAAIPTKPLASRSRRGLRVGVGVVALLLVLVPVIGILSGGDPDTAPAEDVPLAVPLEARERFERACRDNGVSDAVCSCALTRSLEELTVERFLANDELLRTTGADLTAEVDERFRDCFEALPRDEG